ncbi:hypothetical protein NQ317_014149 [Molorchus minor]|uniref:Uncharacterized protein n=1 Tax=Molorchus minor TaxID=1323400 RepID=A0ABQ9J3Y5_9CUCU|nr:hypothetical protein NQ317_014149 [Molorchus minor]
MIHYHIPTMAATTKEKRKWNATGGVFLLAFRSAHRILIALSICFPQIKIQTWFLDHITLMDRLKLKTEDVAAASTGRRQQLGSKCFSKVNQLYRSSSFNSSGRSSTCDTADDMYSDASLEEDVHDLHHKLLESNTELRNSPGCQFLLLGSVIF